MCVWWQEGRMCERVLLICRWTKLRVWCSWRRCHRKSRRSSAEWRVWKSRTTASLFNTTPGDSCLIAMATSATYLMQCLFILFSSTFKWLAWSHRMTHLVDYLIIMLLRQYKARFWRTEGVGFLMLCLLCRCQREESVIQARYLSDIFTHHSLSV